MKYPIVLIIIVLSMVSCNNSKPEFKNENDALSYYLGVYTGMTLKDAGYTEFDKETFEAAVREVFSQKGLNTEAYQNADFILYNYIAMGKEKQNEITLEEGRKFLAKNMKRKNVKTTESGLQYEQIRSSNRPIPTMDDSLAMHFSGITLDGVEFICSDQYAQPFQILQSIPGCREALKFINVGSRYKIYLPTELAFGKNPVPGGIVKENMAVIFDIEIMAIVPDNAEVVTDSLK